MPPCYPSLLPHSVSPSLPLCGKKLQSHEYGHPTLKDKELSDKFGPAWPHISLEGKAWLGSRGIPWSSATAGEALLRTHGMGSSELGGLAASDPDNWAGFFGPVCYLLTQFQSIWTISAQREGCGGVLNGERALGSEPGGSHLVPRVPRIGKIIFPLRQPQAQWGNTCLTWALPPLRELITAPDLGPML